MNLNKKLVLLPVLFLLLAFICVARPALAGVVPCDTSQNSESCTLCHLFIGFQNILTFLRNLLFTATVLFIVVGGVMYMVSAGSKTLMDMAKKAITLSLTGFILFMCSWLLVTVIMTALGYKQVGSWYTFTCDTSSTSTGTSTDDSDLGAPEGHPQEHTPADSKETSNNDQEDDYDIYEGLKTMP